MDQDQGAVRNRRIAMLIDGDNAQPSLIRNMLAETSKITAIAVPLTAGPLQGIICCKNKGAMEA